MNATSAVAIKTEVTTLYVYHVTSAFDYRA